MTKDVGRSPLRGSGHSPKGGAVPSPAEPSVPNALTQPFKAIQKHVALLEAENERLGEYLSALYVNALRSTPETRAQFVSFIVHSLVDFKSSGRPLHEAIKAFDAAQKCSECKAFSPVLGNGLCFHCAPEGQWPVFASAGEAGTAETTGSVHEHAVPKGDATTTADDGAER